MPETIEKLRPDRDLQCYFFRPSSIAALSATSAAGFTVSGTFRQQFDWAVIEWNRDNVIEHPLLRTLPDGDLSGLTLTYDETRTNCIPMDSDLFPTVDWPTLRIWATPAGGAEDIYKVRLKDHATAIEGSYVSASAQFTLQGTATGGDIIGFQFLTEHHTYQLFGSDTLASAAQALVDSVNAFSPVMEASRSGTTVTLTYVGAGATIGTATTGANGNRLGVYTYTSSGATESWDVAWRKFSGGVSPTKWRVSLDFGDLEDELARAVPSGNVRKMRWTYSADLEDGAFARKEFSSVITNWTVTGTNRQYKIAGPGSVRVEDDSTAAVYSGTWTTGRGNFSGGSIRHTTSDGASVSCTYRAGATHTLYLGTRLTFSAPAITISVDGGDPISRDLLVAGEDVLIRLPIGEFGAGVHTVTATHDGPEDNVFYFDFVEAAIPATETPALPVESKITLATDWDTDHSLAIAPERTAWILNTLGFRGRANHYVGALLFYELVRTGHVYASATLTFAGTPEVNATCDVVIDGQHVQHLIHAGDTAETICTWYWLEFNRGFTGIRATRSGNVLTIWSRKMGEEGNSTTLSATPASGAFTITASASTLQGGVDGDWRTDLAATPRINRAARDWSLSYYQALDDYGIDMAAAFSLELQHGDPSVSAGIAQRGPSGDPILLPTPALQTNFSPASRDFWKEVHKDMAAIMSGAGVAPYLQFGETQWWYFAHDGLGTNFSGMPFYDAWAQSEFQTRYGHAMAVISSHTVDPDNYPDEVEFLPAVIGEFTGAIIDHVRSTYPSCRFEVLYPTDVNQTEFNRAINFPEGDWTPSELDCLKTESFGFTFNRNLNQGRSTIDFGKPLGWPASKRAHLVGVMDATTPWLREARMAEAENLESVVLFALDQMCLIGYPVPLAALLRRAVFMGG